MLKTGQTINLFGHKLRIQSIKRGLNNTRVILTCAPQCCTIPNHLDLELPKDELERWIKEGDGIYAGIDRYHHDDVCSGPTTFEV